MAKNKDFISITSVNTYAEGKWKNFLYEKKGKPTSTTGLKEWFMTNATRGQDYIHDITVPYIKFLTPWKTRNCISKIAVIIYNV